MTKKKRLSAQDLVTDIHAGASNEFLMRKYGLSQKKLQSVFYKLIAADLITPAELDARESKLTDSESTIQNNDDGYPDTEQNSAPSPYQPLKHCRACGWSWRSNSIECPRCASRGSRLINRKELERRREEEQKNREKGESQRVYHNLPKCPRCGSTSLATVKSGYDTTSGCCGAILFGPLGLLCGASKSNELNNVCQKCGYKWEIG